MRLIAADSVNLLVPARRPIFVQGPGTPGWGGRQVQMKMGSPLQKAGATKGCASKMLAQRGRGQKQVPRCAWGNTGAVESDRLRRLTSRVQSADRDAQMVRQGRRRTVAEASCVGDGFYAAPEGTDPRLKSGASTWRARGLARGTIYRGIVPHRATQRRWPFEALGKPDSVMVWKWGRLCRWLGRRGWKRVRGRSAISR
jgi:hypothetical protein